ncbi:MAG: metallophosphoesterase [Actinomycetota bacterium]
MNREMSFTTARDADLSLWQSIVERKASQQQTPDPHSAQPRLLTHPLVQAVTTHAQATGKGMTVAQAVDAKGTEASEREHQARRSEQHLRIAQAQVQLEYAKHRARHGLLGGVARAVEVLEREATLAADKADAYVLGLAGERRFTNYDPLFLECVHEFLDHRMACFVDGRPQLVYRDWKDTGQGDLQYSVVSFELPDDAKVGIIGDWGTGMPDAENLLYAMMKHQSPDAIVHLGDVYYSGTVEECEDNFRTVCQRVFDGVHKQVPVFTIPGNHDYYGGGAGFFRLIDTINHWDPSWRQQASYFCLRSRDQRWQFLGMDTGHGDANPIPGEHRESPLLQPSEVEWLEDKMKTFPGSTVLCSHHPVFSQSSLGGEEAHPYLNGSLLETFRPYLPQVAAWFWGHEHSLRLYEEEFDALGGVRVKGRLVGNSAYEMAVAVSPATYAAQVPSLPIALGQTNNCYNHSYAVIDLSRQVPEGAISVDYYETTASGGADPAGVPPSLLFHEELEGRSA